MSILALISIIPLCVLFIMTCVAGLPTNDPTPDIADRSLQHERQAWDYESLCTPQDLGKCMVGVHRVWGEKTAALIMWDSFCNTIGSNDAAPISPTFAFDSELHYVVDVHFDVDDLRNTEIEPYLGYKGDNYDNLIHTWHAPDNPIETFSVQWFWC